MERAIDTRGAVAINVITMVGIGPLITIPLVLSALGGSLALLGWIGGAIVALCDGLVWSELASRFPSSGGTYVYLREAFGRDRLGHALAFLFNWQFLLSAPCLLATGYIGFAEYAGYLAPGLSTWLPLHLCAIGVGVVTIAVLLRRTAKVSATSVLLGVIAVLTLALIAVAALTHANWHMAMQLPGPVRFGTGLLAGFASALYITLYDYVGYADVALLGDEVRQPTRTIPRSIIVSILLVAALYVSLQIGVLGVIPWHSLFDASGAPTVASQYVGSLVVEHTWGVWAARIITLLVLVTAFASVYGNLLGFSRIPYAAARDGAFFPVFARLHPRKHIPEVALVVIGVLSLVASLFPLDQVIAILTAGIVLIQSVMQILALFLLRRRGAAPFRMPLYPLPALIALAGWILAFSYTGTTAIAIGVGWLAAGAAVFLVVARMQRLWPFAAAALAAFLLLLPSRPAIAAPVGAWATWHTSRVTQINGYPVFEVNGKPFFVYGAAFFYERMPRAAWEVSLRAYRDELHINTIDLYVPWNWHEPTEGHLDFTGRTNPRRDLIGVLRVIHRLGLKVVLRPGPVIRNEWRNGGYPDWLLERPEYNMPLHDALEGRYPATATLQNEHADAAANEWLHNRTHLHYAGNWLREALSAVAPYSHDVIAIALDDDQGAYLDNDTWPAPHWHAYVGWLKAQVRSAAGARTPVFINTYEMKVTADSPVWAWGDWYQSDAYSIGEHDREQIDFSTDLLATQPLVPTMMAEFQAGWLQGADEGAPRPADPTNTALALSEFLADGAHGIINFPVQDTIYPAGWEVPWANWAYDWDAAFAPPERDPGTDASERPVEDDFLNESSRFYPTEEFGQLVAAWGTWLAATHLVVDAHVIWPLSLFTEDEPLLSSDAATATLAMLQECRNRNLTCDLADLMQATVERSSVPYILPVHFNGSMHLSSVAQVRLQTLQRRGLLLSSLAHVHSRAFAGQHDNAVLLVDASGDRGFIVASNWSSNPRQAGPYRVQLRGRLVRVPATRVAARSAVFISVPDGRPFRSRPLVPQVAGQLFCAARFEFGGVAWPLPECDNQQANILEGDPFQDGSGVIRLGATNAGSALGPLLLLAPDAGARAAVLQRRIDFTTENFASTIGLFRDAVDPEPTPSARDYIAAFTHPIPAGTFNRPYRCTNLHAGPPTASVTCSYDAPDLPEGGARFERTISLSSSSNEYIVDERMTPHDPHSTAHLKSISGFAIGKGNFVEQGVSCFGVYDSLAKGLARLCWRPDDLASYDVRQTRGAAILTLHFKRNDVEMRLGVLSAPSQAQAHALVEADAP